MDAATVAGWQSLYTAQLGAAANLLGLVFVGLSLNLARILATPAFVARGVQAMTLLLEVLVAATLAQVPGQSAALLGAELLVLGLGTWAAMVGLEARSRAGLDPRLRGRFLGRVVLGQAALLPFVAAGLALLLGLGGAPYWLAAGMLVATVAAVLDAWVLLVEFVR